MTRFRIYLLAVAAIVVMTGAAMADNYGNEAVSTSTYHNTTTTQTTYNDWNPFSGQAQGVYLSGQAGGSFPTGDDFDNGGSYALSLGYQFSPMVRAELEGAYRNNDLEGVADADSDTWTWMLNAFWDFKNESRFTPYLGGGVGWAYNHVDIGGVDDTDNAFVYQLGGGLAFNLSDNVALTGDYRWVDTSDFDHGGADYDYSAHEVRAGIRYTF